MLTTSQCISIVMETKYYVDHLLQDALSMGGSTMVRLCLYVDVSGSIRILLSSQHLRRLIVIHVCP